MLTGKRPYTSAKPLPPDRRAPKGNVLRQAGSFVPKIAAKAFERYGFHSAEIMTAWDRVAGPEFSSFTKPEKLTWPRQARAGPGGAAPGHGEVDGVRPGATLVLRVDPARALDAEYRRHHIAEQINRYFGYRAVETVKLLQAPIVPVISGALSAATSSSPAAPAPLPATLADPGIQAALERLWTGISQKRRRG